MEEMKEETPTTKYPKPDKLIGIRHVQMVMLFLGMVLAYCMRVNMSLAIVAMTDKTNEGSFDWDIQTQSLVLSSYFWGYIWLQIPAGEMAARFGGNLLICICVGINSIITLLIPLASYYGGWQVVCACRVLQGLTQGLLFPSVHNLIGKWAPLDEKNRFGTVIYAGGQAGTAIQLIASGFFTAAMGWPSIFYIGGAAGAVWTAIYVFVGARSPATSSLISTEERLYIQSSLGHNTEEKVVKKKKTPWKQIFFSMPFLSLIIVHAGQNWGFWTLMTEIPSFMKNVLEFDIKTNGLMSAIPYIAMYLMSFPIGYMSDLIIKKKWLTITASRKIFNSIGLFGPALALVGLAYATNITLAVAMLILCVALNAGHYTGFILVHIDMAPSFAGTMMGITNGISNTMSLIAPLAAGAMLNDEKDPAEWRKVFLTASAVYVVTNIIFLIFGTGERQAYDPIENAEEPPKETSKEEKV